jgi:hypothetical protein
VSRPSNLGISATTAAISSTSANTVVIGGNIAPLCDTPNSVLIGNSSTTGYGVGTSVVIGYNNLNSLTDSTNLELLLVPIV